VFLVKRQLDTPTKYRVSPDGSGRAGTMFLQGLGPDYLVIAADLISLRHLKTIELTIWLLGCLMVRHC
jgi:hypothetical protein